MNTNSSSHPVAAPMEFAEIVHAASVEQQRRHASTLTHHHTGANNNGDGNKPMNNPESDNVIDVVRDVIDTALRGSNNEHMILHESASPPLPMMMSSKSHQPPHQHTTTSQSPQSMGSESGRGTHPTAAHPHPHQHYHHLAPEGTTAPHSHVSDVIGIARAGGGLSPTELREETTRRSVGEGSNVRNDGTTQSTLVDGNTDVIEVSVDPAGHQLAMALRAHDIARVQHLVEVGDVEVTPADVALAAELGTDPDTMALLRDYCSNETKNTTTVASRKSIEQTGPQTIAHTYGQGGNVTHGNYPEIRNSAHVSNNDVSKRESSLQSHHLDTSTHTSHSTQPLVVFAPSAPSVHPSVAHDTVHSAFPLEATHHDPSLLSSSTSAAAATAQIARTSMSTTDPGPLISAIQRRDSTALKHLIEVAGYTVTADDVAAAISVGLSSETCQLLAAYATPADHKLLHTHKT